MTIRTLLAVALYFFHISIKFSFNFFSKTSSILFISFCKLEFNPILKFFQLLWETTNWNTLLTGCLTLEEKVSQNKAQDS